MRLIIDGNSLLNTALLRGKDAENGRTVLDDDGKKVQVNSAEYGVDGFFQKFGDALTKFNASPRQCVVVWDGKNAKQRRRALLPGYKAGRDKHPAVNEQLNLARDTCERMLRDLGACTADQMGMEGDDVIGYLCKELREQPNIVVSADGDLSVLVDENTSIWRLGETNKNPYGPFPHRLITLYKALVGDSSDKIPGAAGFGDAAFVDLTRIFGIEGLWEVDRMVREDCLDELAESVSELKSLQKIIDSKAQVALSYRVASLMVDQVNINGKPLSLRPGMVVQWDPNGDMVPELKRFYGTKTLVHAGNYAQAKARVAQVIGQSPFVALDIETSTTEEADEWVESVSQMLSAEGKKKEIRFDVLGSELTGMSLTFGDNSQHTIYMTVDHAESNNITVDQCREMCELIPHEKMYTIIQNRNFEFSVLYRTWGEKWKNNGWQGFVPNAIDSKIGASYVDENFGQGLKERSLAHLGYQQQTHDEVTTIDGKQYKMRELTAEHVFDYGCDDTICTASLHTYYQLVMEMEHTWRTYIEIEQLPEYLTTLAYVQGVKISLPRLREMEKRDDAVYGKAWLTLEAFLIQKGWDGTSCPEFEGDIEPSDVKLCAELLFPDNDFSTKKRKRDAIAADIRAMDPDNAKVELFARIVETNDVSALNTMVADGFDGRPRINLQSPKQMQRLFYEVIGMPPRIVNPMTAKERENPVLVSAMKKHRNRKAGKIVEFTPEETKALAGKCSTDDTAVDTALKLDNLDAQQREVLGAYKKIKTVLTRRGLFYRTYKAMPHWRDGRIHTSMNQSLAVTRRYSSSGPNVQQLPKRGEGLEFRQIILPHHKDAVVVSLDWSGQELRLIAEYSGDENLTSCYVGENLRDVHSLTAVAAAIHMWGTEPTYDEFQVMRTLAKDHPDQLKSKTLREDAKTVNFATNYDASAAKVAETMIVEEHIAQTFMDAKERAFPRISPWKEQVRAQAEEDGFVTTMMGARRHLQAMLNSDNKWEAARAGRQGPNFKIQGSGAEMGKKAIGQVWKAGTFTDGRLDAKFYFPVHDELVFSVHRDQALQAIREVHGAMTAPYGGMKIPIVSSISLGANYGEQTECGDFVDEAAINAALTKAFEKETASV